MPMTIAPRMKFNPDGTEHGPGSWFAVADSKNRGARSRKSPDRTGANLTKLARLARTGGCNYLNSAANQQRETGIGFGDYKEAKAAGRGSANRYTSSNSLARKKASALIAKIPFPLAQHIARCFKPVAVESWEPSTERSQG